MEHASNVLFRIGPLEVTSAVTTMWAIIAVLTLLSWLATRRLKEVPGPLQSAAEIAIEKLRDYYEGLLGRKNARKYFPVFATFFIFIIICNYSGLLPGAGHLKGFALPTASLSVTAGLAIVAFFTTHVIGVRERGWKHYLLSFAQPLYLCILILPLNLIEQFIRPASLALRLYGNMYGEETVTENLYAIFPIGVPLIRACCSACCRPWSLRCCFRSTSRKRWKRKNKNITVFRRKTLWHPELSQSPPRSRWLSPLWPLLLPRASPPQKPWTPSRVSPKPPATSAARSSFPWR